MEAQELRTQIFTMIKPKMEGNRKPFLSDIQPPGTAASAMGTVRPESIQPLSQAPCSALEAIRELMKSGTLAIAMNKATPIKKLDKLAGR